MIDPPRPRIAWPIWAILASLSIAAAACGPVEPPGTPGALKEGGFVYCEDSGSTCASSDGIPHHIAVGATFEVRFVESDFVSSSAELASTDATALKASPPESDGTTQFRALRAGTATIQAKNPSDSRVLDFVTVDMKDVDNLGVDSCARAFNAISSPNAPFDPAECAGTPQTGTVEISQGSSLAPTLCATTRDASNADLGGLLQFDWSSSADGTAEIEILVGHDSRCASLGGLTVGTATLTVAMGNASTSFDVSVKP